MRREAIQALIGDLQARLADSDGEELSAATTQALLVTVGVLLLGAITSMGECRKKRPFSPLRPVIDEDGDFKWCCNHAPEHCSK